MSIPERSITQESSIIQHYSSMEEIRILVSFEEKIRLIQEAERLSLPLPNYLRMLVNRELSKKEVNR